MTTAAYLTRNLSTSTLCWHCGTPSSQLGIVAIDGKHFPNGVDHAAPCPMCEQGQLHALSWDGGDGNARIEFWSQPGWNAGVLSWNGGLTRQHRYTCQRFECSTLLTERGVCGNHGAPAEPVAVPSVGRVPRLLSDDEIDVRADAQTRRVRSVVMNEAIKGAGA
jgi:hypothetical protein